MAHETLKTLITQNIKTNGRNAITAQILQDVLIAMVDEIPDITGYATKTWVQNQGYAKATELSGYATQLWVNTQLGGYLPLDGGTLTGDLFTALHKIISITLSEGSRRSSHLNLGYKQVDGVEYAMNMIVSSALVPLAGLDLNGMFIGSGYKVTDGTSAQFLKADGSVDENTYLPVVNGTISVSSGDMDIYSAGQQGGMATVFEAKDSQDVVFMGSQSYLFDGEVHASAFVKTNGISDEVLCADGSVKTLSELKAALDAL